MDYYGMFPKFNFNRPLKKEEKQFQLFQHHLSLVDAKISSDIKVISINSFYLELVDKYYAGKGVLVLLSFVLLPFALMTTFGALYTAIFSLDWVNIMICIAYSSFIIPCIGMNLFLFYMLKKEMFSWTHYPIRFDRKNRQVHYFRMDGSVASAPWEKIFFTCGLSHFKYRTHEYYISGHILAEDNQTVLDTFCLPATNTDRESLMGHWEFVRRYMEEGPESMASAVDYCLPIAGRRETYLQGLLYLIPGSNGLPFYLLPLLLPFSFIISIPRYIAIQTSKIPVWPEEIDALHKPESDDPYHIDASINSKHPWRDMLRWTIEKK